jgi:fatty acid synthase subunit beta, fungi type
LGNIEKGLIKVLLERYYDNDESKIPVVDYFGEESLVDTEEKKISLLKKNGISYTTEEIEEEKKVYTYSITKSLPSKADWLEAISGPEASWLRALLTSLSVAQEKQLVDNPVKRIMEPRVNQKVKVTVNKEGKPLKLEVFGGVRN